jgi:hypothetical protein
MNQLMRLIGHVCLYLKLQENVKLFVYLWRIIIFYFIDVHGADNGVL